MAVNGTYILEKNENLEGFLATLGLKEEKIAKMASAKPTMTLNLAGDKLEVNSKGTESNSNTLIIGGTSTFTLVSGFEIEVSGLALTGNTAKASIKKGKFSGDVTFDFTAAGFTETFNVGGSTCKRVYKRT